MDGISTGGPERRAFCGAFMKKDKINKNKDKKIDRQKLFWTVSEALFDTMLVLLIAAFVALVVLLSRKL